jgi:uncharacterized protein (TIGR03000 family)
MPEAQPQGASPEASAPSPGSATLRVRVPSQTTILVNGKSTRSTGEQRSYVSHGLQPGQHYVYEVRAELVRGGKTLVETKEIRLRSGQQADLEFHFEPSQTAQRPAIKSPAATLTN